MKSLTIDVFCQIDMKGALLLKSIADRNKLALRMRYFRSCFSVPSAKKFGRRSQQSFLLARHIYCIHYTNVSVRKVYIHEHPNRGFGNSYDSSFSQNS